MARGNRQETSHEHPTNSLAFEHVDQQTAQPKETKCRLCGSHDLQIRHRYDHFNVETCETCGFVQVDTQPTEEQISALYGAAYFDHEKYTLDSAARNEQRRRMQLLKRTGVQSGARVLDVGCATGDFIDAAKERYEVSGFDLSPHAIDVAKHRHPEIASRLTSGRLEAQKYPAGTFDAIVMWDVVEHLWNPRRSVADLVDKLRPGGSLIISTPDIGAPIATLLARRWAFMTPPEHLGFFRRATLASLFESNGLEFEHSASLGKSVSLAFLIYKLQRVYPSLESRRFLQLIQSSRVGRLVVYVPTRDILYAVGRKP